MSIGKRLRIVDDGSCPCEGPMGKTTYHSQRHSEDIQNHIKLIEGERIDNQMKRINARVQSGQISKSTAKFLKNNI
tara:strand:- start:295 stop:522 length:228 start_codon:yes stop_codon:yes gene_type:complete